MLEGNDLLSLFNFNMKLICRHSVEKKVATVVSSTKVTFQGRPGVLSWNGLGRRQLDCLQVSTCLPQECHIKKGVRGVGEVWPITRGRVWPMARRWPPPPPPGRPTFLVYRIHLGARVSHISFFQIFDMKRIEVLFGEYSLWFVNIPIALIRFKIFASKQKRI